MRTYLLSADILKSIGQGALGAMTFCAYNRYSTIKLMELDTEKQKIQNMNQSISMDFLSELPIQVNDNE